MHYGGEELGKTGKTDHQIFYSHATYS